VPRDLAVPLSAVGKKGAGLPAMSGEGKDAAMARRSGGRQHL